MLLDRIDGDELAARGVLERGLPGLGNRRGHGEVALVQAAHRHGLVAALAVEAAEDEPARGHPPKVRAAAGLLRDRALEVGVLEQPGGRRVHVAAQAAQVLVGAERALLAPAHGEAGLGVVLVAVLVHDLEGHRDEAELAQPAGAHEVADVVLGLELAVAHRAPVGRVVALALDDLVRREGPHLKGAQHLGPGGLAEQGRDEEPERLLLAAESSELEVPEVEMAGVVERVDCREAEDDALVLRAHQRGGRVQVLEPELLRHRDRGVQRGADAGERLVREQQEAAGVARAHDDERAGPVAAAQLLALAPEGLLDHAPVGREGRVAEVRLHHLQVAVAVRPASREQAAQQEQRVGPVAGEGDALADPLEQLLERPGEVDVDVDPAVLAGEVRDLARRAFDRDAVVVGPGAVADGDERREAREPEDTAVAAVHRVALVGGGDDEHVLVALDRVGRVLDDDDAQVRAHRVAEEGGGEHGGSILVGGPVAHRFAVLAEVPYRQHRTMDDAKNDAILKNAGLAGIQPEHTVPPHVKQFGTVLAPAEFDEACAVPCPLAVENGVPTTLFANFAPRYIWTLPDSDCLLVAPSAITNSSLCVLHLRVCGPLYTEETPAIAEPPRAAPDAPAQLARRRAAVLPLPRGNQPAQGARRRGRPPRVAPRGPCAAGRPAESQRRAPRRPA
ncbi:hypothetical protein A1Q1_07933 [Trichosporon asahii var. asahii CBS 2479]|uniref:Uncharacterized protein n=1 Tax=Trichosporon asahii var. asahii (strain ATCC 90039 / CBS 2479 / JCM 2466 / KCTC 7840 / NBRC 103889/ NCYC 2677 / UAMH 7654) TaxID=1186058 RepID=J5R644_TRIAS|nr:hypothetical protein A1Q1_07933 [Trichosporon asahii var. asahii CBS 2479]EJT50898.1 hypothetical protein A1Q1_07933 [Trichosporon asahii var. asahii CBS 2479]